MTYDGADGNKHIIKDKRFDPSKADHRTFCGLFARTDRIMSGDDRKANCVCCIQRWQRKKDGGGK